MIYGNFHTRQLFMQMYWSFQDMYFFALGFHLFTAEIMQAESFTLVRNSQNSRISSRGKKANLRLF